MINVDISICKSMYNLKILASDLNVDVSKEHFIDWLKTNFPQGRLEDDSSDIYMSYYIPIDEEKFIDLTFCSMDHSTLDLIKKGIEQQEEIETFQ